MTDPHNAPARSDQVVRSILSQTQALLWASELRFCHQARSAAFSATLDPTGLESARAIEGLLAGRHALSPELASTWLATLLELDRAIRRTTPDNALTAALAAHTPAGLAAHTPANARLAAFDLNSVPAQWFTGDVVSYMHGAEYVASQHVYGFTRPSNELDPALDLPLLQGLPHSEGQTARPLDSFWSGVLVALLRAKWWLDYSQEAALSSCYTWAANDLLRDLARRGSPAAKSVFCAAWELGGWTSSVGEARLMLDRLLAAFEELEGACQAPEAASTPGYLRSLLADTLRVVLTLALPESALRQLPPDAPEGSDALSTRATRAKRRLFDLAIRLRIWRSKLEASAQQRDLLQSAIGESEDALRATGRVLLLQGSYPAAGDFANTLLAAQTHPTLANTNLLMGQLAAFEEHIAQLFSQIANV